MTLYMRVGEGQFNIERLEHVLIPYTEGTRRQSTDPNLYLIEGLYLLDSKTGLLADRTHPSDHGAAKIAQGLSSQLKHIFQSDNSKQ